MDLKYLFGEDAAEKEDVEEAEERQDVEEAEEAEEKDDVYVDVDVEDGDEDEDEDEKEDVEEAEDEKEDVEEAEDEDEEAEEAEDEEEEEEEAAGDKVVSIFSPLDFLKDNEKARENGIKHFAHPHRLYFMKEVRNHGQIENVICMGCGLQMEGYGFSCTRKRCNFHLHQFCALVPRMIDYPNHSQHPLKLLREPDYRIFGRHFRGFQCNVCKKKIWRFCYHCGTCVSFHVDLKCASVDFLVSGRHHEHPLSPKLQLASFMCSLCGDKHGELSLSYECRTCLFWVHDQCYSLPYTLQHASHSHPLIIGYHEPYYLHITFCGVCEKLIDSSFMSYWCPKCNYYLHLNCSHKKWDKKVIEVPEGNSELVEFPMPCVESVQSILAHLIKEKWKDIEEINDRLLHHPSHDHPLSLIDESNEIGTCFEISLPDWYNLNIGKDLIVQQSCNACTLPVLDASFYSCSQSCNFVLHKWCAKLPRETQHPACSDTLLLIEKPDYVIFKCIGCDQIGNGFAYKLGKSRFYLDLRCASLPGYVKHETHEHPLLLKDSRSSVCCSSCGKRIDMNFSYGCDACNFAIDIRCLLLPREITHWYDVHGYKLTYSVPAVEGEASKYHCEFCEMKLNLNEWMYHCFECNGYVDTLCARRVLNIFQDSIKFGGSYEDSSTSSHQHPLTRIPVSRKYDLSFMDHEHPLTCIPVSRKFYNRCSRCHRDVVPYGSHVFSCAQCNIIFCLRCVLSSFEYLEY